MPPPNDGLFAFLRTPDAYPDAPDKVEEIQTHISWVYLAGSFVYKVKKPVSLGFLDFSTLERRKFFCDQEVRLNRRLCPSIYLGVIPISECDGRFTLDDESNVVEYAVKMKRLEAGSFADRLVNDGRLEIDHLDRIVDVLASFYADEPATPDLAAWGRTGRLAISTDENFDQIAAFVGSIVSPAAYDAIRAYTNRSFDTNARLLNERRAGGRILDCHGDLHLEHVYIRPDSVCIYDCIEFNDRFRAIDVANDVAFLAMDLDFHDRPDLSIYLGEQMADRLRDPDMLRMLDFYKTYRAVVRAKVEGMRSMDDHVSPDEREASEDRARSYFRLALRYAVAGSGPLVLIVMGRVAAGKSTLAAALADVLGWPIVSSDRIRKETAGVRLYERGGRTAREALYSAERTAQTYASLAQEAGDQIRRGHGVILDATYSKRADRDTLRTQLDKAGAAHCFIEVTAADRTVLSRLARRDAGEPSISDARAEDFEMLNAGYEAPDDLEDAFHFRVPSDEEGVDPLEECLRRLIRLDF